MYFFSCLSANYTYLISSSGIITAAIALNILLSIIKNTSLYFLFNRLVAVNAPALTKAGASCTCIKKTPILYPHLAL